MSHIFIVVLIFCGSRIKRNDPTSHGGPDVQILDRPLYAHAVLLTATKSGPVILFIMGRKVYKRSTTFSAVPTYAYTV